MVGLVVGQVKLEQLESAIDGLGEAEPLREGMDASDGESAGTLRNLIVDVAGSQDRLGAAAEVGFVEAS